MVGRSKAAPQLKLPAELSYALSQPTQPLDDTTPSALHGQSDIDVPVATSRPTQQPPGSQSTQTRSAVLLNPRNQPYWQKGRKDWDADGSDGSSSSLDLLIRWLEIPSNYDYYRGGRDGGNGTKGSKKCVAWLKSQYCPYARTEKSVMTKVCIVFDRHYYY